VSNSFDGVPKRTRHPDTWRTGPLANDLDFLQMRGRYRVTGKAGDRALDFTAPGAAETFRGR